ncbi:MAG: glycoside hydrolase family 20 zincin-like fold domain-containing protein [Bacteroidota bacterium]|nr:glycoside hydrolase family 20 zincin-like fold domain-containing protein [Bacteroidota bacterium]
MNRLVLLILAVLSAPSFAHDVNSIYPYPKAAWNKVGVFTITDTTKLVIPDVPTPAESAAIEALQSDINNLEGFKLSIISIANYSGSGAIVLGRWNSSALLRAHLKGAMPPGENIPPEEGYLLDIGPSELIVAGSDSVGVFNAVTTLNQLFNSSGSTITIGCAHVWDYPDYQARWVFSGHNLLVASQVKALEAIADTMALYKLNGIQQNDFKYSILQLMGSNYFQNVDSLKVHLGKENIEVIPGVVGLGWSSGILYNDPNLAEGLPARATYVMEADTGRLIPDARVVIANGGFESIGTNGQFTGWNFYDGPGVSTFQDKSIFHGGSASARCTNFTQGNPSGNCRFSTLVNCDSDKYYSMSAWIKTESLQGGYLQMLALGGSTGQSLTFTALDIPSTAGWTRVEVNFNTLGNTSVRLYIGVWGGQSGTVWFDDFSIREAGLSSVIRRGGCPISVRNKNSGAAFVEGVDFATIIDPWVDAHKDSYFPYHSPPTFSRLPGGAIHNGDTIEIHYYHPFASVSDNSGNGSVVACLSEDTLYSILSDQVHRVNNLYHPARFFMGHDEIRNLNHDKICVDRHESPASLLSENMTRCHDLIRSESPAAEVLMWSDMVDSLHNAVDNYYIVNGDLTGDWNNIPKDITIVNWNGGNSKASLKFFEKKGFSQITSPYYDVGNTSTIRAWRIAQEGISNVRGMMYTTWANDYNFLRPFAYYAWGAGPNIQHTPLDTSVLGMVSFQVKAIVIADPFDKSDVITSVKMNIVDSNGKLINSYTLSNQAGSLYSSTIPNAYQNGFRYDLVATNSQGLTRVLPTYIVMPAAKEKVRVGNEGMALALSNYPNPFRDETSIQITLLQAEHVELRILDVLGREVKSLPSEYLSAGSSQVRLEVTDIPSGSYIFELRCSEGIGTLPITILK